MTSNLDEDILPTMIGVLESGIEMAHQGRFPFSSSIHGKVMTPPTASPSIDPKLRMEKFLVQIVSIINCHSYHLMIWRVVRKLRSR